MGITIRDLLAKYTDDEKLIEQIDTLLDKFSEIESIYEFLSAPMEYFIEIPFITIEMCELIDKVKRNELQTA